MIHLLENQLSANLAHQGHHTHIGDKPTLKTYMEDLGEYSFSFSVSLLETNKKDMHADRLKMECEL